MNLLIDFKPIETGSLSNKKQMSNKRILYEETVEDWQQLSESYSLMQTSQVNPFATAYYIGFGFINSTIGVNTLNTSSCNEYLNVYYDNFTEAIP